MAWFDNLYMWTGIAIVAASAFIGLAYMLSRMFQLPMLEAWVKVELHELVASMVIAMFCVSMIASVDSAAKFLSGSTSGDTAIGIARDGFLRNQLYADGQSLYKKLVGVYFELAKLTSYSYNAGVSVGMVSVGYSSSPAAGLSPLQSEVGAAIDGVGNFMMLAASQSAFLLFFGAAVDLMLPIGIFLRSFSMTRKIGGVVLAGAIAVAVVYPAGILLTREIYSSFSPALQAQIAQIHVDPAPNPPLADYICSDVMKIYVSSPIPLVGGELGWFLSFCLTIGMLPFMQFFCSPAWANILTVTFYIVNSTFPLIVFALEFVYIAKFETGGGAGAWGKIKGGYYDPIYQHAMPAVAQYSVLSLLAFIFPLLLTMSMLRNLAVAFGGEPQLYGISKLI